MKFSMKHIALVMMTALTLTACGGDKANTATAQPDSIKARQDLMQDWRGANDIMKGMLENPNNFDQATFKEQAEFIQKSTAQMWGHFGDANAKGDAQEAVWTDAQGFQAQKDNFDKAINDLVAVVGSASSANDVQGAFGAMAETCGACHKVYKK